MIELWGPSAYWMSIICVLKNYLLCTDILVSVDASKGSIWFGERLFFVSQVSK